MEKWITIIAFSQSYQAYIAKSKLENNDIEVFLKDELTIQIVDIYSDVLGGVKLQVRANNVKKATKILIELGYIDEAIQSGNKYLKRIDNFTKRIPILKKTPVEFKIVIILTILISFVGFSIYYLTTPSIDDKITQNHWCIDSFTDNNKRVQPHTTGLVLTFNNCNNRVVFSENGEVIFPGFNTPSVNGNWTFDGEYLEIFNCDTLNDVYSGKFKVNFIFDKLEIESERIKILSHPYHFQLPF